MAAVQSVKLRKRFPKALRIATWTVAGIALLIAEIFIFGSWGSRLEMRILGFVNNVCAIVIMGLGLYRLKVAAEGVPQASFWPGMRAVSLGAVIIAGCTLGTIIHGSVDMSAMSPDAVRHSF